MPATLDTHTFLFQEAGRIPNNPWLPVVVYKHASPSGATAPEEIAGWFEQEWKKHGWRSAWRWGVYDFPHYHSTAHEILGVYRGRARLRLGHTAGETIEVEPGDVVVLPAGTGHQNLGSTADFHVVGGYPRGQEADVLRESESDRPAADQRISQVPLPAVDPLFGKTGPLTKAWHLNPRAKAPR